MGSLIFGVIYFGLLSAIFIGVIYGIFKIDEKFLDSVISDFIKDVFKSIKGE